MEERDSTSTVSLDDIAVDSSSAATQRQTTLPELSNALPVLEGLPPLEYSDTAVQVKRCRQRGFRSVSQILRPLNQRSWKGSRRRHLELDADADDGVGGLLDISGPRSDYRGSGGAALSTTEPQLKRRNHTLIFLILLGILCGGISVLMDAGIYGLNLGRLKAIEHIASPVARWFVWWLYLLLIYFGAVTLTAFLSPQAAGSGVPEMKTMLSGISLGGILTSRALVTKIFGVVLALGSGMIVGKEGPMIHLSAILAAQLMRLPLFRGIRDNEQLMQIMLGAACATGVAAHFGAAVGGVLFTIEITSAYYPTRNYWYAYSSAVTAALVWTYCWNAMFRSAGFQPIITTNFAYDVHFFGIVEMISFCFLGMVMGVLGVFFVRFNAAVLLLYRNVLSQHRFSRSPYFYSFIVCTVTAILTFPNLFGYFNGLSPVAAMGDLVYAGELTEEQNVNADDWARGATGSEWLNVLIFFVSRCVFGLE